MAKTYSLPGARFQFLTQEAAVAPYLDLSVAEKMADSMGPDYVVVECKEHYFVIEKKKI